MKKIILTLLTFWIAHSEASLKERLSQATPGDYIVTAQEGHYSVLLIRTNSQKLLSLEEISVPAGHIQLKQWNWKKWVEEKAPGHTSWVLYEIDPASAKLISCFSYSKNGWIYLDESEQFLTQLMRLPLEKIPEADRKKIGPQPPPGGEDRRAVWNPPLVIEGKKASKPTFEAMRTKWPEDGSKLSLCTIELYFSKENPTFPYWMQIQSPHYAFKVRTIDSGHQLISPQHPAGKPCSHFQKSVD
jgi:hypothetical protein